MTSTLTTVGAYLRLMARSRAFALVAPPPDAELRSLLELGEAAALLDPGLAIELSSVTTPWLRSVFPRGKDTVTTFGMVAGQRFSVDAGDVFAATVAAGHLGEARDFEAFMHLVRPGAVVVDVGANFGLYAVSAALYARPMGQVFAFEPAPGAFAMLERNIAENGVDVTAIAAAIGAVRGRAQFYVARDVSFSSLHETSRSREAEPIEVEVATLDAALGEVKSIDLLKIDVEGGEAAVLVGARDVLDRSRSAIVQFEYSHKNLNAGRHRDLLEAIDSLRPLGFRVYRRDAGGASGLPSRDELFSGNLFLAREGESERRLRDALEMTNRSHAQGANLAALALLRCYAEQRRAAQEAGALKKKIAEIADSVVGNAAPEAAADAMRAVQTAWLEARKRVADAEGVARALAASVEGRDRLIEHQNEKVVQIREVNQTLIERNTQLQAALKTSNEKIAAERLVGAELRQAVDREVEKRKAGELGQQQRLEVSREVNSKLVERTATLQAALKVANVKIAAMRNSDAELRIRLHEVMAQSKVMQHELARVRNVAKRMVDRYEALRIEVGAGARTDEGAEHEAGERAPT